MPRQTQLRFAEKVLIHVEMNIRAATSVVMILINIISIINKSIKNHRVKTPAPDNNMKEEIITMDNIQSN